MDIMWLEITDPPELWRQIGFVVDDAGRCVVNGVEHRLVGAGHDGPGGDAASGAGARADIAGGTTARGDTARGNEVGGGAPSGVVAWGVRGIDPSTASIDGIATTVDNNAEPLPSPEHPNGVFRIDHLVIRTSSTPRTIGRLEALGLASRGGRSSNSAGTSVDMRFCWAGDTLLELVGPPTPGTEPGAQLSGIAYASNDLDATAELLGALGTTPVDAVQPGRRIAALRSEAGSTVPVAFMTPHRKA